MNIIPEPAWISLLDELRRPSTKAILIGSSDSGKTTLARFLMNSFLKEDKTICFVDADIGQSTIGPPSTISMKIYRRPEDVADPSPDRMIFVGTFNPGKKIPEMINGTVRLVEEAQKEAIDLILIDTTGLISGNLGRALKTGKIKAVKPDHIIAIQRDRELEHILTLLKGYKIHRLIPSPHVKSRRREARIRYRDKRLREYFKESFLLEIPLNRTRLLYNGRIINHRVQYIKSGTLVGLNLNKNTLALGVVDQTAGDSLIVITPLKNTVVIDEVEIGDVTFENGITDTF